MFVQGSRSEQKDPDPARMGSVYISATYHVKKFWQFLQKNKMASVGISRIVCATIGRLQPPQRDMPREL
jgi:hypothetical protein